MPLAAGARLGHHEIVGPLGAGELKSDLYLRSLRADPRWNELLVKVGLPAE